MVQPPTIPCKDPGTLEDTSFESSHDGLRFRLRRWSPSGTKDGKRPRAGIVFCHGYIEHIDRYNHVFPLFAESNIYVSAFDQRGFGQTWSEHKESRKQHGNTSWKQQMEDLEDLIVLERKILDEKWGKDQVPLFLMGHSMGGGISLAFFTRPTGESGPSQETKDIVQGVICSSPWIKLTHPPPGFLVSALQLALRLYGNMPYYAGVEPKDLSKDKDVQEWTRQDKLCDGHVYLKSIAGPLLGGVKILNEEYKNWPKEKPLLVTHGSADKVTSPKASEEFTKKVEAEDKEFKGWEGYYHEGWQEVGDEKVEFIKYIIGWIQARTPEQAS